MRRLMFFAAVVAAGAIAVARGVPEEIVTRRGLTAEQYDALFAKYPEATVRISAAEWRAMRYQLFRFANMTNWIDRAYTTNGLSRLMLDLQDGREKAEAAERIAEAARTAAERMKERAEKMYAVATNDTAIAETRAAIAEARAERLDSLKDWLVEQRDKALLPTTKAIYQAIIDRIEERAAE